MIRISCLHQVNGVNDRDIVFIRCLSVCLSVCVQRTVNQTSLGVIATDFKFDVHVPTDSPDVTP